MVKSVWISFDDRAKVALRRDAQVRRQRIIEAAVQLYQGEGPDVPMDRVAECAGVGRATLYRNFPDRTALSIAVLENHLERFAAQMAAWADRDDAFFLGVRFLADLTSSSRGFEKVPALERESPGVSEWCLGVMGQMLSAPLARAKTAGLVRQDFPLADYRILTLMIAGLKMASYAGDVEARVEKAMSLLTRALAP
jgi:AcrR family transcriptional regulator